MNLTDYILRYVAIDLYAKSTAIELKIIVENAVTGSVTYKMQNQVLKTKDRLEAISRQINNFLSVSAEQLYTLECELFGLAPLHANLLNKITFGETSPVSASSAIATLTRQIDFVSSELAKTWKENNTNYTKLLRDSEAVGVSTIMGASWLARSTVGLDQARVMTPLDKKTCAHCAKSVGSKPVSSSLPHMRARSTIVHHGIVPPRNARDWESEMSKIFSDKQDSGFRIGVDTPPLKELERINELYRGNPVSDLPGVRNGT